MSWINQTSQFWLYNSLGFSLAACMLILDLHIKTQTTNVQEVFELEGSIILFYTTEKKEMIWQRRKQTKQLDWWGESSLLRISRGHKYICHFKWEPPPPQCFVLLYLQCQQDICFLLLISVSNRQIIAPSSGWKCPHAFSVPKCLITSLIFCIVTLWYIVMEVHHMSRRF